MIERLAWDSDLFGYEVGMVNIQQDLDMDNFNRESQKFQLVYIYSRNRLSNIKDNIKHVGTKVTFQIRITGKENNVRFPLYEVDQGGKEGIFEFSRLDFTSNKSRANDLKGKVSDALTNLAIVSGEFSHFKLDERLGNNEFQNLYTQWIRNAIAGKDRVLTYVKEDTIIGLITFFLTDWGGRIGLLAVSKAFRGNGIGTQLLKAAIMIAVRAKLPILEVGTQKANTPAMALYQKNGFRPTEEMEVYHFTCFQKP